MHHHIEYTHHNPTKLQPILDWAAAIILKLLLTNCMGSVDGRTILDYKVLSLTVILRLQ